MMHTCLMKSQLSHFIPNVTKITPKFSYLTHTSAHNNAQARMNSSPSTRLKFKCMVMKSQKPNDEETTSQNPTQDSKESKSDNDSFGRSLVIAGAASVGVMVLLMMDKAWALGPEGPLVEEFWENVRRYALYALTVSTGVIYTVVQPIFELLKNPISAVLVLIIIGGSIFIVSQILSAMVGVSEFSYDYAY
uniref:Uncharacterized protein ycf33 n=1 Tax=Opuntia streptacantha TaxID=393608 RepID=A0A7C8YFQ3_OPUST